jgi:hypothetical protein
MSHMGHAIAKSRGPFAPLPALAVQPVLPVLPVFPGLARHGAGLGLCSLSEALGSFRGAPCLLQLKDGNA